MRRRNDPLSPENRIADTFPPCDARAAPTCPSTCDFLVLLVTNVRCGCPGTLKLKLVPDTSEKWQKPRWTYAWVERYQHVAPCRREP